MEHKAISAFKSVEVEVEAELQKLSKISNFKSFKIAVTYSILKLKELSFVYKPNFTRGKLYLGILVRSPLLNPVPFQVVNEEGGRIQVGTL